MVREWKEAVRGSGVENGGTISSAVSLFWAALFTLLVITYLIFTCAEGASKDKASATNTNAYGSTCGGCGGDCGG